jgi:flagellar hook-length control protein FliK
MQPGGQAGPGGTPGQPPGGQGNGVGAPGTAAIPGAPGSFPTAEGGTTGAPPGAVANITPMLDTSQLAPPDGAQGPPPDETTAAPPGTTQTSGGRLEKHLRIAPTLWSAQAELAKASSKPEIRALAADIDAHAQTVPPVTDHMPPMQDVAGYLASSRVLLDKMAAAGMDVADLSLQVDMMMRPPRGKIPGGPKGGAGQE